MGISTLIPHARQSLALSIGSLVVPMIEAAFGALLQQAVSFPALQSSSFLAAALAAIGMSTVTRTADEKRSATIGVAAKALSKNWLRVARHPDAKAGLDNGHRSWQAVDYSTRWCALIGTPPLHPDRVNDRGVVSPPAAYNIHQGWMMMRVFDADDINGYNSGECSDNRAFG